MFLKKWIKDIKEKTSGMNRKDALSYIANYYWYHILIFVSIIALIVLFGTHYLFRNKKPEFTCVMVNQRVDTERDGLLEKSFAEAAGLNIEETVIDSDYNFSYGDVMLEGVNESSYEKFFFQWRNGELDAVILPESFYQYCKEMGGEFREIEKQGSFSAYLDEGKCTALILGEDTLSEAALGKENEQLLLAFPSTGKHEDKSRLFLDYLIKLYDGDIGGMIYGEIFN